MIDQDPEITLELPDGNRKEIRQYLILGCVLLVAFPILGVLFFSPIGLSNANFILSRSVAYWCFTVPVVVIISAKLLETRRIGLAAKQFRVFRDRLEIHDANEGREIIEWDSVTFVSPFLGRLTLDNGQTVRLSYHPLLPRDWSHDEIERVLEISDRACKFHKAYTDFHVAEPSARRLTECRLALILVTILIGVAYIVIRDSSLNKGIYIMIIIISYFSILATIFIIFFRQQLQVELRYRWMPFRKK